MPQVLPAWGGGSQKERERASRSSVEKKASKPRGPRKHAQGEQGTRCPRGQRLQRQSRRASVPCTRQQATAASCTQHARPTRQSEGDGKREESHATALASTKTQTRKSTGASCACTCKPPSFSQSGRHVRRRPDQRQPPRNPAREPFGHQKDAPSSRQSPEAGPSKAGMQATPGSRGGQPCTAHGGRNGSCPMSRLANARRLRSHAQSDRAEPRDTKTRSMAPMTGATQRHRAPAASRRLPPG